MPKPLKYVLLVLLIVTTVLSFRYASRRRVARPQLSGRVMPYFGDPPPLLPPAEWTEHWERYTYAGEEFSVELPETPFVHESSRRTGLFDDTQPVRTFGIYSGGAILILTSFDNPRDVESDESFVKYHWPDSALAYARNVKSGDFGGGEYQSEVAYFTRTRLFRTRHHAYLVCAISMEAKNPRAGHFLDSFVLGGTPEGKEIQEPQQAAVKAPVEPPAASAAPKGKAGDGVGTGADRPADLVLSEPFRSSDVPLRAVIVFKPSPDYTEEARMNSVEGTVRLRAVLKADGKVGNISVIRGLPDGLTEKAVDSARHLLFFPAIKDGRTVSMYVTLEYNFNIY